MNNKPVTKAGEFVLPDGFVPVTDFGDIFSEDIDDDDDIELWFMQVPHNVDLKQLNKQKLELSEITHLQPDESSKTMLEFSPTPYDVKQVNPYNLLMPKKADKTLGVVKKKFSGHILVSQTVNFPSYPQTYGFNSEDDPRQPTSSQAIESKIKTEPSDVKASVKTEVSSIEEFNTEKKASKKKLRKKSEEISNETNVSIKKEETDLVSFQEQVMEATAEPNLEVTCASYFLPKEPKVKKSKKKKRLE